MTSLFPESCMNQAFVNDFYKEVINRLMPKRTLTQILREAETVEEFRLNPVKIQEEYEEFLEKTVALQHVLRALNVCSSVTRFSFSHPFAVGLGEVVRELAQRENASATSGKGPIRMCEEPPYVGGDPEMRHLEVNPGVGTEQFNLWRDLRAMYTRCEVAEDCREGNDYFIFKRLQMRWDESVRARRIARTIRGTPGHECISRRDICLRNEISTDLLLHELRNLERVGQEIILPKGGYWGLVPLNEERWVHYECEFCGIKYCTPVPM